MKTRIGIEETVRFFISDGLARRLPQARIASANPVVRACRMVKTATEIALMQAASDVTLTAQRWAWQRIRGGMTPGDIAALIDAATAALGGDAEPARHQPALALSAVERGALDYRARQMPLRACGASGACAARRPTPSPLRDRDYRQAARGHPC